MRGKLSVFISIWLCLFSAIACAANQTALRYDPSGSDGWYPYYISSSPPTGIAAETIQKILETAKITGEYIDLPPKRTLLALEQGEIDFDLISPAWLPNKYDSDQYVFSAPILRIREHIIYLHGTPPPSTPELAERRPVFGTIRGYYYHDEALFQRMDFGSERAIIRALAKGRIQYAISGDLPALYWAKRLNVNIELGTIHSDDYLVMRLRAEHQNLLKEINIAIAFLKQNEEIATIINKYTKHSNLDNAIGTY